MSQAATNQHKVLELLRVAGGDGMTSRQLAQEVKIVPQVRL